MDDGCFFFGSYPSTRDTRILANICSLMYFVPF